MSSVFWAKVKAWWSAKIEGVVPTTIDPATLPLMERCRYAYQNLDTGAFVNWRQTYGHRRVIKTVHPNIDACMVDLASHTNNMLNSGHVLDSQCSRYVLKEQPLNQFLTTAEGFYQVSVAFCLQDLADAVITLCDTIDESSTLEYQTRSYNLRMLNSLLFVLLEMADTFDELSKQIAEPV